MTIELSYERFTNKDDIVPSYSAEVVIRNTGDANTLYGDDRITGVGLEGDPAFPTPAFTTPVPSRWTGVTT